MSVWVKVCGVTRVEDAMLARDLGVDALGLNFVAASPRCIDLERAQRIRDAVSDGVELVAVVADLALPALETLVSALRPDWVQLHGAETPEFLDSLLPGAYKAIHVREAEDVEVADAFGGRRILVDAKVPGQLGGTGVAFDYSLTAALARRRELVLAGGLTPSSVAMAIAQVRPFGVDVASGVEPQGHPGLKDSALMRAFVEAVKAG